MRSDPGAAGAESAMAAAMPVTYRDVERAEVVLVVGLDAENELPILHLRIRKAARRGAKVFVVHPRRTRLWDVADHRLCLPGEEAASAAELREELQQAGEAAVLLAGPRLLQTPGSVDAMASLARQTGSKLALLCRRANDRGALMAGLHPALLPGGRRVGFDDDRRMLEEAWGAPLPAEPGRDAAAILEAAARREIDVLFLVGTDPLRDFPDARLVRHALENAPYKVVVDISAEAMDIYADAMLPAAPYLEKDGHYTNWEGRTQRLRPVRSALGLARSEWEIFQELSEIAGADMGLRSLNALHEEMAMVLTSSHGSTSGSPSEANSHQPLQPPADGNGLALFTYALLVDEGKLSAGADRLKEALEEQPFVEIHPQDAERLGITDGQHVRLHTSAGEAALPARVTDGIAAGCVFVPWNQPGFAANTILSGSTIAPVTIEPVAAEVPA
jgi:NADH-quinone oxidoreductase subunit G